MSQVHMISCRTKEH